MMHIAKEFGFSDRGLGKLCVKYENYKRQKLVEDMNGIFYTELIDKNELIKQFYKKLWKKIKDYKAIVL